MFTGIIQNLGHVISYANGELEIATSLDLSDCKIGSSICCNGVCLTATQINFKDDLYTFKVCVIESVRNYWNWKIVNAIVRKLENSGEGEIRTALIGQYIMEALANLDQVAYVRFASVYKNFREVKDFEDFLGNLEDK